jgi:hypothetical protein
MTTNPEAASPMTTRPVDITAGVVLLGTAAAGFHDLASLRPPGPAQLRTKAGGHVPGW